MDTMPFLTQIFTAVFAIVLIFNLTRLILMRVVSQSHFTKLGRHLGKMEECLELIRTEQNGTGNCCYVITFHAKEKLREPIVRDALTRLAKRQPLLRAVMKTVTNSYWFGQNDERHFEIIEKSKVGDMIDLTTSDLCASQWQKEWCDIATRPRNETDLLWQAVWFREEYLVDSENYVNTIIFRTNHCIVDGVSGMKLCKQFLSQLNHVSEDPRVRSEEVPSLELLPGFYDILNDARPWTLWRSLQETLGLHYIVKFIISLMLIIYPATKPEKPYDFFTESPSTEQRDFVYKVFSESETSQICRVCKRNGTTVTGALVVATHLAFCTVLQNQNLSSAQKVITQRELMFLLAINGLRVCKPQPPVEYLGNYSLTEVFPLSYESNKDNFWLLAQEATTKIHTILKEEKYVTNQLDFFRLFTPKESLEVFSPQDPKKKWKAYWDHTMSSAGAFTFDEHDTASFKLHQCFFYSIPFGMPCFSGHYNTTVNGKMAWAILCNGFLPSAIQEQFAKDCFDTLMSVVNEEQASM